MTKVFALFILRDIPDSCPLVLEAALKMLVQMVTHWKSLLGSDATVSWIEVGLKLVVNYYCIAEWNFCVHFFPRLWSIKVFK